MSILNENYFKMSNAIFHYGLLPNQLAVYSYLICCAGQRDYCWPSVKTIAACCEISENTVRKAISVLEERGFIRKVESYQEWKGKSWRQSNNHYYILDLPPLPRRSA